MGPCSLSVTYLVSVWQQIWMGGSLFSLCYIPGVSMGGDMAGWVPVLSLHPVFCGNTLRKECPGSEGKPPHSRADGNRCISSVWLSQRCLYCRTPEPKHSVIKHK